MRPVGIIGLNVYETLAVSIIITLSTPYDISLGTIYSTFIDIGMLPLPTTVDTIPPPAAITLLITMSYPIVKLCC